MANRVSKIPLETLSDTGLFYFDDGSVRVLIAGEEVCKFDTTGVSIPTAKSYQVNDSFVAKNSQADIDLINVTFSANDPSITPDQSVTIADGSAPTVSELLEYCEELRRQHLLVKSRLQAYGVIVS